MRDKYLHTNCLAALANMSGRLNFNLKIILSQIFLFELFLLLQDNLDIYILMYHKD